MPKERGYTFDPADLEKPFVCTKCAYRCADEGSWKLHNYKVHTEAGRRPTTGKNAGPKAGLRASASPAEEEGCPHDWILLDPGRSDAEANAFEAGYTRLCPLCGDVS